MTVFDLAARRGPWIPEIHRALCVGVETEVFPGGAVAVVRDGVVVHESAAGSSCLDPAPFAATSSTLYDLASLTKVVATTAVAAVLVGRKKWAFDAAPTPLKLSLRALLSHSSGLPAWKPYFLDAIKDPTAGLLFGRRDPTRVEVAARRGKALITEMAIREDPVRPAGVAAEYSDVGFIQLGAAIEAVAGQTLDVLAAELVFRPLSLPTLGFRSLGRASESRAVAATGVQRPREGAPGQEGLLAAVERVPDAHVGEVDDDNAYAMGGVAGHAGLFGTARDVAQFGSRVIEEAEGAARLAPSSVWAEILRRDSTPGSSRALGFDTPSGQDSQAGNTLSASRAFGHLGFTGTSLWFDLDRRVSIALLTNRVHPTRANEKIRAFRGPFHDAVIAALPKAPRQAS